jgi:hypothetical protein
MLRKTDPVVVLTVVLVLAALIALVLTLSSSAS